MTDGGDNYEVGYGKPPKGTRFFKTRISSYARSRMSSALTSTGGRLTVPAAGISIRLKSGSSLGR